MIPDLSTTYLGLPLRSPFMPSASPLTAELDRVKKMEDAGAAAIVLPSLFEEQLERERQTLDHHLSFGVESNPESLTYFPATGAEAGGPDRYLEYLRRVKASVSVPVIASLNGKSPGGWTRFAGDIEAAGADALELNIYFLPSNADLNGRETENVYYEILSSVRAAVHIPVAVKLSPFFSNLPNMARRLCDQGARGLVLFNRFYQPDVNLETLTVEPRVLLSTAQDLRLPLTWTGILYGRVQADIAASGGIHSAQDALKLLMTGATVTQLCSALYRNGVDYFRTLEAELRQWMEKHEYGSVVQLRGSLSQINAPDPGAFERAQYVQAVHSFKFF